MAFKPKPCPLARTVLFKTPTRTISEACSSSASPPEQPSSRPARIGSARSGTTAYMRLRGSRKFFEINIFSFPRFNRLASRERSSALMAHGRLICLAALSGQPPEPGGSRRKARGVDGESACRATMMPGHYAANVIAFCVAVDPPLSALKF